VKDSVSGEAGWAGADDPAGAPLLRLYPLAVLALLAAGLVTRLWQLDSTPNTLNLDDLVAIRLAGSVLAGHGPGILALDGNGQPALAGYLQALSLSLFGDTAWALRLPAALLGVLALPCFLLVARACVAPWPALGATTLFAFSTYAMSLTRAGWINDFAMPAELCAIWCLLQGWRSGRLMYFAASGAGSALAAYGYAPFRLLVIGFVPLLLCSGGYESAVKRRQVLSWLAGYVPVVMPLVIALLLQHDTVRAYLAMHQLGSRLPEYAPGTAAPWIAVQQFWRLSIGLVLLMPGQVKDLDLQHVSAGRWLVDGPCLPLYWIGLWQLAAYRGARHRAAIRLVGALWVWLLVVPVLVAEVPVRDSPSLHPAVAAYPIYLLVCALGLSRIASLCRPLGWILMLVVLATAVDGIQGYANWINTPAAMQARQSSGAPLCVPAAHLLIQPCAPVGAAPPEPPRHPGR
jgi:4-amino-4-deoxy-L-arabinose transferase-like glycosyltransferase